MDPVTVSVGVAAMGYGAYTAWARRSKPEQFKKLEPMKRFWGERGGLAVHVVGYTVVPIVFGIVLVVRGLQGGALF
jgi:hypothetical protein